MKKQYTGMDSKFKPLKLRRLIPHPNGDLAEFIGVMLGDGNIYEDKTRSIHQLRITCHKNDDQQYVKDYLMPLFQKLFNLEANIYYPKSKQAIVLYKQSKNLVYTLKHYGLVSGNKHKNNVGIPDWIFEKENYIKRCIGGLVDTDGSLCPKTRNHKTPTIYFNTAIPKLRDGFKKSLELLNYRISKWNYRTRTCGYGSCVYQCSIGNREDVLRYYKEIGFQNPKHKRRFDKFWKAPVV